MKRLISLLLCCTLLFTGCAIKDSVETQENTLPSETTISFEGMNDPELLPYVSDQVYLSLKSELNTDDFIVEDVQTTYISKEYLEELEYNSKENVYFGFTLSEIAEQFDGSSYVFAIDENGETVVQEVVAYDDTYDKVIKNVAIGTGVILLCVTVALVTKNPAATVGAGKTIKAIFAVSSTAAKSGTAIALKSSVFGGTISTLIEATKTDDIEQIAKSGILGASESYKWGAIFGTLKGTFDGIRIVNNTHYFPDGTTQAKKYPQGVEFTKGPDGEMYPRFEKWAKATAKFKAPTKDTALNHTGLSGEYYWDMKLANAQCGYTQTPAGYTWHHVEDMKTMILVPQDLHSVYFGGMHHVGGASLIRNFLGL